MSRCTHGYPSANSRRNQPPAIVPAPRPAEFFTSATSDLRRSRYSSHSGSGQQRSPARSPASRTSPRSASSVPMIPIATWPSAMTTAPVRVAASSTAAGLKRRADDSASHKISRSAAAVLEHDEARLLRATLSDGEQRPHALLLDPLAVEGGDGEAVRVRESLRFRGEVRGRAHVPGQDLEVAGAPMARGDGVAHAPARLRVLRLAGVARD